MTHRDDEALLAGLDTDALITALLQPPAPLESATGRLIHRHRPAAPATDLTWSPPPDPGLIHP